MTKSMDAKLRKTRRQMLRKICQLRRSDSETWTEYVMRATHAAEQVAASFGHDCWTATRKKHTWKVCGKTARDESQKWSSRLLAWRPWHRITPSRRVGRPVLRWDDEIVSFAGTDWRTLAHDEGLWMATEHGFVQQMHLQNDV